jgi:carotenoid cleavage dioxygenase-like enzyme
MRFPEVPMFAGINAPSRIEADVGFGYAAKGDFTRDVVYFEVTPQGRVVHQAWFELPYYEMQHDCGVTQDYIVFPVVPILGAGPTTGVGVMRRWSNLPASSEGACHVQLR